MSTEAVPEIIVAEDGSTLHITLNRPRAINALTPGMLTTLRDALRGADGAGYSSVIIDGAGDRGLCGGGDIKFLFASTQSEAEEFLTVEYEADGLTGALETTVVSFMHGITMGGGLGVSAHASLRVVAETAQLAMPENRIGLAPDVGSNALLARAPGFVGEYLAMTAATFTAGDAVAIGFADAFVPEAKMPALKQSLAAGTRPNDAVASEAETAPDSPLLVHQTWIDECFGQDSAGDVLAALESHSSPHARETAAAIRALSPVSVAVSFWAVRLAKRGDPLDQIFARDVRTMTTLLDRYDGREGIRAQVIDKDRNPHWSLVRLEDVTTAQLEDVLGAEVLSVLRENRV